MNKPLARLLWGVIAILGAVSLGAIALHRGEPINALWLVVAATCCYALGYRFYSGFISTRVLALDALRATPAERLENGRDFLVTNKWVVFGHHFAAITGAAGVLRDDRSDLSTTQAELIARFMVARDLPASAPEAMAAN